MNEDDKPKKPASGTEVVKGEVLEQGIPFETITELTRAAEPIAQRWTEYKIHESDNVKEVRLKHLEVQEGIEKRDFRLRITYFIVGVMIILLFVLIAGALLWKQRIAEGLGILAALISALGGFGAGYGVGMKRGKETLPG